MGTFPYNHVLTQEEAIRLAGYVTLAPRGVLYVEGGNTWVEDPPTALHPLFGITGSDEGEADLGLQRGTGEFCLFVVDADYDGENRSIDRLVATADGLALFRRSRREAPRATVTAERATRSAANATPRSTFADRCR